MASSKPTDPGIEEHPVYPVALSTIDLRYFGHVPWVRNRFNATVGWSQVWEGTIYSTSTAEQFDRSAMRITEAASTGPLRLTLLSESLHFPVQPLPPRSSLDPLEPQPSAPRHASTALLSRLRPRRCQSQSSQP
jgi:hypothetical protein